jgi:diguanylate cyclase
MASLKYFDSTSRSKELLKYSIAFIGSHRLSANPINYTVSYEYLSGGHSLLKKTVDKALSDKTTLTDQMMGQWFETFFSADDQTVLSQSQADLMAVIAKITESAILAEENVSQFDNVLRLSEKELINASTPLESVVAQLLVNTRTMQVSMELMRQQMKESKEEISSLQERLERATEEALTDALTGLTNRKGLSKAIDKALVSAEEIASYPCLLMLDIDHFKKINDTHGHLLGDRVIKIVAETIRNQVKGKDTAARYGGEEFCVLLPETALSDAEKLADNIRLAVEKTRIKRASDNQEICRVTISVGVARFKQEESISAFFERADGALYQSKNDGRNRVTAVGD